MQGPYFIPLCGSVYRGCLVRARWMEVNQITDFNLLAMPFYHQYGQSRNQACSFPGWPKLSWETEDEPFSGASGTWSQAIISISSYSFQERIMHTKRGDTSFSHNPPRENWKVVCSIRSQVSFLAWFISPANWILALTFIPNYDLGPSLQPRTLQWQPMVPRMTFQLLILKSRDLCDLVLVYLSSFVAVKSLFLNEPPLIAWYHRLLSLWIMWNLWKDWASLMPWDLCLCFCLFLECPPCSV